MKAFVPSLCFVCCLLVQEARAGMALSVDEIDEGDTYTLSWDFSHLRIPGPRNPADQPITNRAPRYQVRGVLQDTTTLKTIDSFFLFDTNNPSLLVGARSFTGKRTDYLGNPVGALQQWFLYAEIEGNRYKYAVYPGAGTHWYNAKSSDDDQALLSVKATPTVPEPASMVIWLGGVSIGLIASAVGRSRRSSCSKTFLVERES